MKITTISEAVSSPIGDTRQYTTGQLCRTLLPLPYRSHRTPIHSRSYCHRVEDPLGDLFELMICTGMRKGEILGLRWKDVDLEHRVLYVRHTLVSINNSQAVLSDPKTEGRRAWVALSHRAVEALRRQQNRATTNPDGRSTSSTGPAD